MKNLQLKLAAKLKNNAGESLAEVLIALLIAALALTMLASVISSAGNILTRSQKVLDEYYEANEALANQEIDETNTMKIQLSLDAKTVGIEAGELYLLSEDTTTEVCWFENSKVGDFSVISYCLK